MSVELPSAAEDGHLIEMKFIRDIVRGDRVIAVF